MASERKQCCIEVWPKKGRLHKPCRTPATVQHGDWWYCWLHNPNRVADSARRLRNADHFDALLAALTAALETLRLYAWHGDVLNNDPGRAQEAVELIERAIAKAKGE